MEFNLRKNNWNTFFRLLALAIILLGITVRVIVYLQNRNLFIDEANLARNVFERNFLQLAQPLSYEQYAPPVFMWMLQFFTSALGYGELAFRIFPLLSSVAALIVMYFLLKELTSLRSLWYPLGLMVVGYYMIRYSTELKQYMSDVLITLSLLLLAVRTKIPISRKWRFLGLWLVAGTIAIWSAMPSVFILAGIGAYYFFGAVRQKQYKDLMLVVIIGILWLVQFAVYYFAILKPQIDSEYLQKFHQDYFLCATPVSKDELVHNINVLKALLQEAAGFSKMYLVLHILLLAGGVAAWLIKDTQISLLVLVPLALVIIAAALNQYSLIPRVALFVMPLLLLVIGYGWEQVMSVEWKLVPISGIAVGLFGIYSFSSVRHMTGELFETEQITDALDLVKQSGAISGNELYIHNGARPAYIYYTQIHPDKNRWSRLKDAHLLYWGANYGAVSDAPADTIAFIFTSVSPEEFSDTRNILEQHRNVAASVDKQGCHAFIYSRKIE